MKYTEHASIRISIGPGRKGLRCDTIILAKNSISGTQHKINYFLNSVKLNEHECLAAPICSSVSMIMHLSHRSESSPLLCQFVLQFQNLHLHFHVQSLHLNRKLNQIFCCSLGPNFGLCRISQTRVGGVRNVNIALTLNVEIT